MVKVESLPIASPADTSRSMDAIGRTVGSALQRAVYEKRVVIGVAAAVKELLNQSSSSDSDSDTTDSSAAPSRRRSSVGAGGDDVVFCVLAPPAAGDSATHMQTILLEAFCYENDIYIIKVDSAAKLSRAVGARTTQTCALIQRSWHDGGGGIYDPTDESYLTAAEAAMVDHCEEFWDVPQQPMVQLPD